jgi:hypothetical protein
MTVFVEDYLGNRPFSVSLSFGYHGSRTPLAANTRRRDHSHRQPRTGRRRMTFGETEPSEQRGGEASAGVVPGKVTFSRRELDRILGLYGRMVAAGEWRDYAIDFLRDRAVFSVFRRSSEVPLYRIEKNPRLARKQGAYSVISATGLIVKRGHELDGVLRAVDKSLKLVAV